MNATQQFRKSAIEEDFFRLKQINKRFDLSNNQIKMFMERSNANSKYYYLQLKLIKENDLLTVLKTCVCQKYINWLNAEFNYSTLSKCVSVHHLINLKSYMVKEFPHGLFQHIKYRLKSFKYKERQEFLYDISLLKKIFSPFNTGNAD